MSLLLPYQSRWVADKSQVKMYEKSRRIGISWAEAYDSVMHAGAASGANVYYISYDKEMTQGFIEDCAGWAGKINMGASAIDEQIIDDEGKQILTYKIEFDSGHSIQTFSSSPRKLRSKGKPGERLVIDEAAFVDHLDELLKAGMAFTIWGGSVRIISTHDGELNPFNNLVNDVRAGKYDYSLHRTTFDDALADGLFKQICMTTGDEWSPEAESKWRESIIKKYRPNEQEELFCVPSTSSGGYLTRTLIEGVMQDNIPVIRLSKPDAFTYLPKHIREAEINDWCEEVLLPVLLTLNPTLLHYFGSDFARISDLSVIWVEQQLQNLNLHTPFVVELRNVPFEQQRQILFYIIDRLPRFMAGAMDARGNGQYLAEVAAQKYGATRIAQVMLSQEWYRENMPRFKDHFESKTRSAPKDADILEDMRAVKKDKGVAKVPDDVKVTGSDGKPRHGDSAIACALADYAVATMEPVPMEFESAGRRDLHASQQTPGPAFFNNDMDLDHGFGILSGRNDSTGFI